MELQRYEMGDYCSGYVPNDDGEVCMSYDVQRLEESHAELLKALKELYYTVQGECPSLLDEDSGGSAYLDIEITNAITNAEGIK